MANVFNSVKGLHPKRNAFSAHTYRNDFSGQLGLNIPVYQQHVVPGTKIQVSTSALVRLQALISPIMDNIDFYVHFWKIPYRLLEDDRFTKFISGELDPDSYTGIFCTPKQVIEKFVNILIKSGGQTKTKARETIEIFTGNGSLFDYLGYDSKLFHFTTIDDPVSPSTDYTVSGANNATVLNFRPLIAYYYIHLNWYMNENVPYTGTLFSDRIKRMIENDNGLQNLCVLYYEVWLFYGTTLLPHGWDKDYFTSALPNVQFGDPVSLSLQGTAPVTIPEHAVVIKGTGEGSSGSNLIFKFSADGNFSEDNPTIYAGGLPSGPADTSWLNENNNDSTIKELIGKLNWNSADGSLTVNADLSEASAITINELRFANALQVFKEREERFGRRRQEYYKGFFDVTPEDLRLTLPKYLGGGRIPINISDIEQTSATSGSDALGHIAGKGTAVAGGFAGFTTFCSEESIILGIAFAMPHITYSNFVSKFLLKTNDRYDYFNPSFEHLGEQEITHIEVFSGSTSPNVTFGYTPRFNEYRFHTNELHGDFKGSLSYWTLGRIFSNQPYLNYQFVYMNPSNFDRIFAVSGQNNLLASMLFRARVVQPVSKYGTPMLIA